MILIFSIDNDHSTNEVCNILLKRKVEFIRINDYSFFSKVKVIPKGSDLKLEYQGVDLLEYVTSVWYRREPVYHLGDYSNELEKKIKNNIYYELKVMRDYIVWKLRNAFWLNHPYKSSLNKLLVLEIANECGFVIPDWFITNEKDDVYEYLQKKDLITKPMYETIGIEYNDNFYNTRTIEVTRDDLDKIDNIEISLFQEKIEKETEIRVVYINNKVYPMEIFSQKNEDTKLDFRNYNIETPLRFSGHKIPYELEQKIHKIMKKLDLNFGSFDFILTKEEKYIFLEINPVGQFGMTSKPNNYGIEYEVANVLCQKG